MKHSLFMRKKLLFSRNSHWLYPLGESVFFPIEFVESWNIIATTFLEFGQNIEQQMFIHAKKRRFIY